VRRPRIVYAHGFRSSSRSKKATLFRQYLAARGLADCLQVPDLDPRPTQAISQLQWLMLAAPGAAVTVVGSSLGAFYATVLAERLGVQAVLVNPPVRPHTHLARYIGLQRVFWSDAVFEFTTAHVDELRALALPRIARPERLWLVAETGDDLCPVEESSRFYAGCRQTVLAGGSHEMKHFGALLPEILRYAT
jgi:hypothetical protein